MLLNQPPSPQAILSRLGEAIRHARKTMQHANSDEFGRSIGVSGRTLRALESSGKGSTESLVRVLLALCPEVLEELIESIESADPPYTSIDDALNQSPLDKNQPNKNPAKSSGKEPRSGC